MNGGDQPAPKGGKATHEHQERASDRSTMTSGFDRFVFIALPGRSEYVVAGRFRVSGGAAHGEFVYGHSYLSRPDAVELDPVHLRLTGRVRRGSIHGVFGAIRDTMQTSWGRFIGSNDYSGAVAFAPKLDPPAPRLRFDNVDDLTRLKAALESAPAGQDAPPDDALAQGQKVTGESAPKAIVEDERKLWIAKFPRDDMIWNHLRVRHATLQLARDCGIDAVPSRIESVQGEDVLLVRRYDRAWVGDGYTCCRLISGFTLLGTDDTSPAKHSWSYLALADQVRRASSHPREDLRELFGRMCFNAAISSLTDDPRPPMMVAKGTGWRLAPASSPVPTPLADGEHGDFAMICGPHGRTPSRENIVGGAGRFLLDRAAAEAIYNRISATVQSSWYDVMRGAGVSVHDCDLVRPSIRGEGNRD